MHETWTYKEIGQEIGQLVDQKNAAYGSSFAKAGEFLRLLYPNGLRPEQMTDALLLVRIFDKQMRIATDADALGESPYQDISGYGLLGARMHHERKSGRCGSVSGVDAAGESKEPSASAAQAAPAPIGTNADGRSAKPSEPPSPKPLESTSNDTAAPVAERSARDAAAARARALNDSHHCGNCGRSLSERGWHVAAVMEEAEMGRLLVCGPYCFDALCDDLQAVKE
jgi:pyruvate/2-oxoglutarate dehydrogenase complex dihydrolipoamide acyltransferase (E2) component